MKKRIVKQVADGKFSVGDSVRVLSTISEYNGGEGIVTRLGWADETEYIHVALAGVTTVITFRAYQLQKGS